MFDATLNTTLENSPLSIAFSALSERSLDPLTNISLEQGSFPLLADDISVLTQTIKAIPFKLDTPILFTIFANWVAHLQTNQALADDFEQMDDSEKK